MWHTENAYQMNASKVPMPPDEITKHLSILWMVRITILTTAPKGWGGVQRKGCFSFLLPVFTLSYHKSSPVWLLCQVYSPNTHTHTRTIAGVIFLRYKFLLYHCYIKFFNLIIAYMTWYSVYFQSFNIWGISVTLTVTYRDGILVQGEAWTLLGVLE